MRFLRDDRSGVAIVEFALLSPLILVTMLTGIFIGLHMAKRVAFERALDTKAEIIALSRASDRFIVAARAFERTYGYERNQFASYVFNCTAGGSCTENSAGRSGTLVLSDVNTRIASDVATFEPLLPAGERFIIVAAYFEEPAGTTFLRFLGRSDVMRAWISTVVPINQ